MAIKWPEIQYREAENGMLEPMISFPKQPEGSVGKYGEMRREYLMKHRKASLQLMSMEGSLKQHLMDVNEQAHQMIEDLTEKMLRNDPAPDKLRNQLGWIQHMNSLKAQAEEIVLKTLIFA